MILDMENGLNGNVQQLNTGRNGKLNLFYECFFRKAIVFRTTVYTVYIHFVVLVAVLIGKR